MPNRSSERRAPTRWIAPLLVSAALPVSVVAGCSSEADSAGGSGSARSEVEQANVSEAKKMLEDLARTRAPFRQLEERCKDLTTELSTATGSSLSGLRLSEDTTSVAPGTELPVIARSCSWKVDGGGDLSVAVQTTPAGTAASDAYLAAWKGGSLGGTPIADLGAQQEAGGRLTLVIAGGTDRGLVLSLSPSTKAAPAERAGLARSVLARLGE